MRMDPVTVPTAANTRVVEYQGGENGEVVTIYNPSTNSNNVFLALNRNATTAAVTGQVVVAPGQWSPPFILTEKDNRTGINGIAATGDTVVSVLRQTFRDQTELNAVLGGIFGGMLAAQYWVAVSATAIALSGAFVTARVDTLNNKTSGTALLVDGQGTTAVGVGTAAIAATGATLGEASTRAVRVDSTISGIALIENGTNQFNVVSGQIDVRNNTTFLFFNGNGSDERLGWTPTHSRIGVTGNGASDGVFKTRKFPIKSAEVLAAGDLVSLEAGGLNRVRKHVAGDKPVGKVINGGTGDAGGTVFADVTTEGFDVAAYVADTAGCTEGQYLIPGAVDPTKVQTQAVIEGSFAECRKTAASGNATDAYYNGVH